MHVRGLLAPLLALALALGAFYAMTAFGMARGAPVHRSMSSVFDMDVSRVVVDFTTARPSYRASVHPLQKLFVAPVGSALRWALSGRQLAAARVVVAGATLIAALLAGLLAWQLAERSRSAAIAAALVTGVSFSSILAASVPESAAVAALAAAAPFVFANARSGRTFGWGESVAWGVLLTFGLGLTVTQVMAPALALIGRCALLRRSGAGRGLALRVLAATGVLGLMVIVGTGAQSRLYPGTPEVFAQNPLETEAPFLRLDRLGDAPLRQTMHLALHFSLIDFAAPQPAYSDFLIRQYGIDSWSLSVDEAGPEEWRPAQRALGLVVLLAVGAGLLGLGGADRRFVPPALFVASQFVLHLAYGREYILYAPHWHGVVVALLIAGAWRLGGPNSIRNVAVALLTAGLLANNLWVLSRVYDEVRVGFDVEQRDAAGRVRDPTALR